MERRIGPLYNLEVIEAKIVKQMEELKFPLPRINLSIKSQHQKSGKRAINTPIKHIEFGGFRVTINYI